MCFNTSTVWAQYTVKNNWKTASCTWQDTNGNSCEDKNCNKKCDKYESVNSTSDILLPNIGSSQLRGTFGGTDPCRIAICNGYPLNFFKQQTPAIQQSIIQQREKGVPLEKVIVKGKYPFAKTLKTKTLLPNTIKPSLRSFKLAFPK